VRTVDAGGAAESSFRAVLREAVDLLDGSGIPHVIIGGIAVAVLARPRWTHDIDVFLRPDDAQRALDALGSAGFRTEESDPIWLFKAEKDGVLVDLIFRSTGYYYFDDRLWSRSIETTFKGERLRVIGPEDLIVIKAAAHMEEGGYHWFDALALLSRGDIDWAYLLQRGRRAVRRLLSLLVYAESLDIAIPREPIAALYDEVYGDEAGLGADLPQGEGTSPRGGSDDEERLRERLQRDPRIAHLDPQVAVHSDRVVLMGEVDTPERARILREVTNEVLPDHEIDDRTTVRRLPDDAAVEEIS
jgi:predicted nucleotidyltransferase